MAGREKDLVTRARLALLPVALDLNGEASKSEKVVALAEAILAVVAVIADPGEEHGLMADFKKAVRLGVMEAIERKPQYVAEAKRRKK